MAWFKATTESSGCSAEVGGNVMIGNATEKRRWLTDIVFMELGYGYKGVFNGGLSMRF
ncbi:hypothetical protein [Dyadobacter endophyticus]|uniref:Outer membrane autotransporter barrel domain-containing protein n=1 Tax=Dyadobacter endophyticus TaxID=1749036 RepID=A0ABQ1ZA78_9BACT|nr:hypothetical protein [Dyadobacter endophyticus]GGH52855.1 hypothetical protein GCM10007423_57710 [Dyadobacter endophyticus]